MTTVLTTYLLATGHDVTFPNPSRSAEWSSVKSSLLGFLTLEDGTDKLSRNVRKTLRNSPEERISHVLRGGSLKLRKSHPCRNYIRSRHVLKLATW